jgi:hypothetical protein
MRKLSDIIKGKTDIQVIMGTHNTINMRIVHL